MIARTLIPRRLLTAAAAITLVGCGAHVPPTATPPPAPIVTPAIAQTSQPAPAPAPKADPIPALIGNADAQFALGQQEFQAGHLVAARDAFDRAVDVVLSSPGGAQSDPRLAAYFEKLVDRITALETIALRQGDGFTESRTEPAVIDELLASAAPAPAPATTADAVEADLKVTPHDLPIVVNSQVLSYVELFRGSLKGFLEDGLRRGSRYLPMIEDTFRSEGIPLDLAYVPLIESAFKSDALSRASAKGMWQFESDTAKEEGLQQNWFVDERSDPEKATLAAASYLKDLNQMFDGDWYLALASYNCGMGRVQKAIKQAGVADFWKLAASSKYLPRDTREYVPMILAAIIVARNPDQYGLDVSPLDPLSYDKVTVPDAIGLARIAEWTGATLDEIKDLNPELRRLTTPVGPHEIKVPKGTGAELEAKLAAASPDDFTTFQRYAVRRGDTLAGIARKFNLRSADLLAANGLSSSRVKAGQSLMIPSRPSAALASHPAAHSADSAASSASGNSSPVTYRVKSGDTLYGIALKFDTTVNQIKSWNKLKSDDIGVGDRLTLFRKPQ